MHRSPRHSPLPTAAAPTAVPLSPSCPAPGEPSLKVPKNVTARLGEALELPCHSPCKFYSYDKYWCKWSSRACRALPSHDGAASQGSVSCDQSNQRVSLVLNPVTKEDQGWYWCGVKEGLRFGETAAVYVEVKERISGESPRPRPPASPWGPQRKALSPNSFSIGVRGTGLALRCWGQGRVSPTWSH